MKNKIMVNWEDREVKKLLVRVEDKVNRRYFRTVNAGEKQASHMLALMLTASSSSSAFVPAMTRDLCVWAADEDDFCSSTGKKI